MMNIPLNGDSTSIIPGEHLKANNDFLIDIQTILSRNNNNLYGQVA